jgi:hypothetical protein
MKTLAVSILCLASVALADDFKMIDGKEYKNVKVSRVEPDGVVISFSGGIVKIPFTELSPEIQKKYGYDAKAAADFQQQTYQGDVLRARQLAEAKEKRRQELGELSKAQPQPPAPVAPAQRQSVAASMHGSALDQRPVTKTLIYGKITNVVDEGLLVEVLVPAFSGQERIPADARVLLAGNFPGFYDDDRIQVLGIPAGTRDHVTISPRHTLRTTVRVFEVAQISKLH